jgi:multiple sugar transport system substrate-binding protein
MRQLLPIFYGIGILLLVGGLTGLPHAIAQETITLAMLAGFKEDVMRANIGAFEQKTGIKVNIDASPYGDLYKKQLLSLSAGTQQYDVLFIDEPWIPALSSFLLPLDEFMSKVTDVQDIVSTTLASGQYQGKQFALPVDPNVQIFIYRKDLFQEKGLKPPTTWAEVLQAAKALHDPAKEVAGFVMTAGGDLQTFAYATLFLWSWGVEILDDNGKAAVNTPAAREALEFYLALLKYAPAAVRSYSFADVNKTMQLGKAAMAVQWASGARPMEDKERSQVAGKLGYTVMPKHTRTTPMRGVWTIGIAKTTPKKEAAWKFVEWLSSKDFSMSAALYPATTSAIHSPRVSVLTDPKVKEVLPYAGALLENLRVTKERARVPQWPDIQEQLRIAGAKITTGEVSVADGLKELETNINRIMGK